MTEELNYDIEFELSGYSTEESLHAIREEWPALLAASEKSLPLCGSLSLSTVLIKQLSKRNVTPTEIVESIIKFLTDYRAELLITHTSLRESELGDTAAAALLAYLLSFEGSGQTLTELDLSSLGGITMAGHYAYGFGPKCRSVLLKANTQCRIFRYSVFQDAAWDENTCRLKSEDTLLTFFPKNLTVQLSLLQSYGHFQNSASSK